MSACLPAGIGAGGRWRGRGWVTCVIPACGMCVPELRHGNPELGALDWGWGSRVSLSRLGLWVAAGRLATQFFFVKPVVSHFFLPGLQRRLPAWAPPPAVFVPDCSNCWLVGLLDGRVHCVLAPWTSSVLHLFRQLRAFFACELPSSPSILTHSRRPGLSPT